MKNSNLLTEFQYKKLLNSGDSAAIYEQAKYLLYRKRKKEGDLRKVKELLDLLVGEKYVNGINLLAWIYKKGLFGEVDYAEAERLLKLSLDNGSQLARIELASGYMKGIFPSDNPDISHELIEAGKKKRSKNFFRFLGDAYLSGDLGNVDLAKSIDAYEAAIDLGDVESMYSLALIYSTKKYNLLNIEEAKRLFQNAVNLNHVKSMRHLSRMYRNESFGIVNIPESERLLKMAISLNDSEAMFQLALMYLKGAPSEVDDKIFECLEYFSRSSELGNIKAARILGLIYIHFEYEENIGEREEYLKKGTELLEWCIAQGDPESMFLLAKEYREGRYLGKNINKSIELMDEAASLKYKDAELYQLNDMIKFVDEKLIEKKVSARLRRKVKSVLVELEDAFFEIRDQHLIFDECNLSHFTTWDAIKNILDENPKESKNRLRQYHVDYMNDPSEGQRLLDFNEVASDVVDAEKNKAIEVSKILKGIFKRSYYQNFLRQCPTSELPPSIFMLSFTKESDDLDLWRAYGNDGKGLCLKFHFDSCDKKKRLYLQRNTESISEFANAHINSASESVQYVTNSKMSINKISKIDSEKDSIEDRQLQEEINVPIIYDVKYSEDDVKKALLMLRSPLMNVISLRKNLKVAEIWENIEACISSILLELLYLYKDEQYSTEREVRVLSALRLNSPRIKADERVPGHLYCETDPFLFVSPGAEIILGPKIEKKAAHLWNIRYRLTNLGFADTTTVKESKVLYR